MFAYDPLGLAAAERSDYYVHCSRLLHNLKDVRALKLIGDDKSWVDTAHAQLHVKNKHHLMMSLHADPGKKMAGTITAGLTPLTPGGQPTMISCNHLSNKLTISKNPPRVCPGEMRRELCNLLRNAPSPVQAIMSQLHMADNETLHVNPSVCKDAYINAMACDGQWGSDVELLQLATLLNCPIVVYEHPCDGHFMCRAIFGEDLPNLPQFLLRINRDRPEAAHYVLLVPISRTKQLEAALVIAHDQPFRVQLTYGPYVLVRLFWSPRRRQLPFRSRKLHQTVM